MATFTAVDDPQAHFQIKLYTGEHGSGSGTSAKAPALVVADVENPAELHKTLVP